MASKKTKTEKTTIINGIQYTLKENGRIDFFTPPVDPGDVTRKLMFIPLPVDDEYIRLAEIDRRLVRRYKFSRTWETVYMCVEETKYAPEIASFISMEKVDHKRKERKRRCKIISPKTGKPVFCPDTISCSGEDCPLKKGEWTDYETFVDIDEISEVLPSNPIPESQETDDFIERAAWKQYMEYLEETSPVLHAFTKMIEQGKSRDTILAEFGREGDLTWYYRTLKKVKLLWKEFTDIK